MWMALLIISFLIWTATFVGIIVGLFRGVARKGWSVLAYSTVILIVSSVLLATATEERVAPWLVLYLTSIFIGVVALVGILVGLIVCIARRRWRMLAYSTVIFIVFFTLFVVAEENGGAPSYTENVIAQDKVSVSKRPLPIAPAPASSTQARVSDMADNQVDCKSRFRSRKSAVMALHNDGLLDAYGLSDIGVLDDYGISVEAAISIADILYANGLYGLQNHYDEIAHAICFEIRHDEKLILDGTREAYVNR